MRNFALSFALLVAGLITFAATPAQAQSVDFGISIGTKNGGVSVHVGNDRHHGGYRHYPRRDYPRYEHPRRDYPRYDYPRYSPRPVLVYETHSGWVYNKWTGRTEWRQWTTERWVTPYYSRSYGCYGYTDYQGYFRCMR